MRFLLAELAALRQQNAALKSALERAQEWAAELGRRLLVAVPDEETQLEDRPCAGSRST